MMPNDKLSTDLPAHIHEAELATIQARRIAAGLDGDTPVAQPGGDASVNRGLIGLAISGGGIRSSTFSLGVLQSLARARVFKRFDFMSTVSGGGYTGSMLSALLKEPGDAGPTGDDFPLAKPEGENEPAALQHLRNGSNYLNPGGPLDGLRLPAVVIRGLLMNTMLVLPHLMVLVVITEWLDESRLVHARIPWAPLVEWLRTDLNAGAPLALALVLVYFLVAGAQGLNWKWRDRSEHGFAWLVLLGLAGLLLPPALRAISFAMEYPFYGADGLTGFVSRNLTGGSILIAAGASFGGYAIVRASKQLTRVASKVLLALATVSGPLILFGMYLLLVVAEVDSPYLHDVFPELDTEDVSSPVETQVVIGPALHAALALKGLDYRMARGTYETGYDSAAVVPAIVCPGPLVHLRKPDEIVAQALPATSDVALCAMADDLIEQQSQYIRLLPVDEDWELVGARLRAWGAPSDQALLGDASFILVIALLYLFNFLFLDVNKSSLHGFYRDRLSKLYLFRRGPPESIVGVDDLKLSELNQPGSVAPYHIVNTTVNLEGVSTLGVRGRGSDFFFFSKHFCGGPNTGYVETKSMEDWDKHVNLGTAMAISAAAAAPNMGRTTVRSMVFMLTVLNLRLGYWVPNPQKRFWGIKVGPTPIRIPRGVPRARSPQLWREATSALTASGPLVNLSDGGHLENLAIYELLRRRCKTIVAIDGEADPKLTFEGLVTLIRFAKIDLGVEINIDLDLIKWDADDCTQAHYAIGTIDYGAGDVGTLVYVKSSVTGDEGPVLKKYRADHGTFPHESTADQFFDELQFEAYLSLGTHVGHLVARRAKESEVYGFEDVPTEEAKV